MDSKPEDWMPGRPLKTTPAHRAVLYILVIILGSAFTIFLFMTWNHLQRHYSPDAPRDPTQPDMLDHIHEHQVAKKRAKQLRTKD